MNQSAASARLERAEEQARLTTVEPESLGRGGSGLQRFLRGDDWLKD